MNKLLHFYISEVERLQDLVDEEKLNVSLYQLKFSNQNKGDDVLRRALKHVRRTMQDLEDAKATVVFMKRRLSLEYPRGVISESLVNEQKQGEVDQYLIHDNENLEDMSGAATGINNAGRSAYLRQGQDEYLSISEFFARPVEITSLDIAVGDHCSQILEVWDAWSLDPSVRAKLHNYAYLSGDLHIRFVCTGTVFHMQKILLSYQPYDQRNVNLAHYSTLLPTYPGMRDMFINYLSQAPGSVVIDVRNNAATEMVCPFISTKNMHRLYNTNASVISSVTSYQDLEFAGALYIYSINELATASDDSTDVSVQVYAWMENIELGCTTATQMVVSEGDEQRRGPIERMATSLSYYSDMLSVIPPISTFARASSEMFKGLSGVASWFGWSRPAVIVEPIFVKNEPFRNGSHTIGGETLKRIGLDPQQELTVDPRIMGVDHDEMVITNISSIQSYLTQFTWSHSDARLANAIFISYVHPMLATTFSPDGTNYVYQPSAMAFAVAPFEYWHATLEFTLEVVCSNFHRGKLAVGFEPNIAQMSINDTAYDLNKNFLSIIDIQQTQTATFCVEWAHPRAWAHNVDATRNPMYGISVDHVVDPITGKLTTSVNGYIFVVPFTDLTSPNGSSVQINVYVRAKDLMVNQLDNTHMPTDRSVVFPMVVSESAMYHEDKSEIPVECFRLVKSNTSVNGMSLHHFGEQPLSFRSMCKRYVTTTISGLGPTSDDGFQLNFNESPIMRAHPRYGASSSFDPTVVEYLPYAFLGYRGGMRKRIHAVANHGDDVSTTMGPLSRCVIFLDPVRGLPDPGYVAPVWSWANNLTRVEQRGSVSFVPHTNGGIEFEIPFYSNNLFLFAFTDDYIGDGNATNDMDENFIYSYTAVFEYDDKKAPNYSCYTESAIGEDFTFFRYQGAPFYSDFVA